MRLQFTNKLCLKVKQCLVTLGGGEDFLIVPVKCTFKKILLVCYRSFGVLLLEIITFADTPLEGIKSEEIVEMAQKSTLNHKQ